jgi:Cys-tRNA(Pro) deacylase
MDHPITPAVRLYREKGGTAESAKRLNVDEHAVIKTLIFETDEKKPLIVLMHGDRSVSSKNLARQIGVRSAGPASPERANKWTGYMVGGTSPFGTRTQMPVFAESTIFDLERIYINGGKRGFLVEVDAAECLKVLDAKAVDVAI